MFNTLHCPGFRAVWWRSRLLLSVGGICRYTSYLENVLEGYFLRITLFLSPSHLLSQTYISVSLSHSISAWLVTSLYIDFYLSFTLAKRNVLEAYKRRPTTMNVQLYTLTHYVRDEEIEGSYCTQGTLCIQSSLGSFRWAIEKERDFVWVTSSTSSACFSSFSLHHHWKEGTQPSAQKRAHNAHKYLSCCVCLRELHREMRCCYAMLCRRKVSRLHCILPLSLPWMQGSERGGFTTLHGTSSDAGWKERCLHLLL